jgi:SAM-dependent methyltransferase
VKPGLPPAQQVRDDFNTIARLSGTRVHGSERYLEWLLEQVPVCESVLDVGCGAGGFTRLLASRATTVLGIDLSPAMIETARAATLPGSVVRFEVMDVMTDDPGARFDVVTTVATLHHLPLAAALRRLAALLHPGGTLVVLDLLDTSGLRELPRNGIAWIIDRSRRLAAGWPRADREVREAWEEHMRHDRYDTWPDLLATYAGALPGATLRRHLLWRYSAIWRKPRNG